MKPVKAPKGAQLLYFPMMDCTIAAGFKNEKYERDYGYVHYLNKKGYTVDLDTIDNLIESAVLDLNKKEAEG